MTDQRPQPSISGLELAPPDSIPNGHSVERLDYEVARDGVILQFLGGETPSPDPPAFTGALLLS
jgi:hypothetical protein